MRSILVQGGRDTAMAGRLDTAMDLARTHEGHLTVAIDTPVDRFVSVDPYGGTYVAREALEAAIAADDALAAAFAVTVTVNTGNPLIGAMLFPVGFIMLYLMGFDLLTGVFTLAPLAVMDKRPGATWGGVMRNWGLVFCGNFAGALTVAVFMAIILTFGFSEAPGAVGEKLGHIGEGRTLGYSAHGAAGMLTLFVRAVMCNWMVSTGVVAAMMSTTVSGKAIGMWMPVMVFFYMGFEHSIVNMFLFPTGLMLGGNFTLMDYLIWNELPTVLGIAAGPAEAAVRQAGTLGRSWLSGAHVVKGTGRPLRWPLRWSCWWQPVARRTLLQKSTTPSTAC